jgi:hypothetical protein
MMTLNPIGQIIDAWAQPASKRSFELLPEIVPHLSFERCAAQARELGLSDTGAAKLFSENARRVFKLDKEQA